MQETTVPAPSCTRRTAAPIAISTLAGLVSSTGGAHAQPGNPVPTDAARAALAPTGRLRAALIVSNPVLVQRDATTGALGGVSVELARALADRLGVPLEIVPYPNPAAYAQSLRGDIPWDVGFAARDPARAEFVHFSPNFMEVDNVFLVPPGSRIRSAAEVDRVGVRVAVPEGSAPDLFLTRSLTSAEVVRVPGGLELAVEALTSGLADAYGENAQLMHGVMARLPAGARILEGRFNVVHMAIALPRGRNPAGIDRLAQFVAEVKRDGTVARAIERAGLRGVHAIPD
jgi:polar amino acid transport system substrate-binding protein